MRRHSHSYESGPASEGRRGFASVNPAYGPKAIGSAKTPSQPKKEKKAKTTDAEGSERARESAGGFAGQEKKNRAMTKRKWPLRERKGKNVMHWNFFFSVKLPKVHSGFTWVNLH